MRRQQEVKRYAKMLLNTVGVEGMPPAINELMTINELMLKNSELKGLLENPLFTGEDRERVVKELSKKLNLSDNAIRFIIHFSEQRIISNLPQLIRLATAIYLEKKKKAMAVVTTPVDIRKRYDDRLKASLKSLTGRDVDIEYAVDPSLLGGILIKVGSTMYDSSIKGQLRLLREDLMKG